MADNNNTESNGHVDNKNDDECDKDNNNNDGDDFILCHEAKLLFDIALPSVAVQFSLYWIYPQSASSVGRNLGSEALGGFSLGSLVGNLTCLSVMIGVLTACDTLMPRAYGDKRYKELGRLVVRTFLVGIALMIPLGILLFVGLEWVLLSLGQDPVASQLAADWIRIYLAGIPASLIFRTLQRFLNTQHKPWLPVVASVVPSFLCQPLLLQVLIPWYGFEGSAMAVVTTQWLMTILLVLLLYCRRDQYHPDSIPEWSSRRFLKDTLRWSPLMQFLNLGMGGVVSLSEWWYWETMCFVAGSFGLISLCAHTIAYNLIPLCFMTQLGIGMALTVRMGTVIVNNHRKAIQMAIYCMGLSIVIGTIIALCLYQFQLPITQLFTNDPAVIKACQEIWYKVCIYLPMLFIMNTSSSVMRVLGMQWNLAISMIGCLWIFSLAGVVYFAMYGGGGLSTEWTILPIGYALLNVVLIRNYVVLDWQDMSEQIKQDMLKRQSIRASEEEAQALQEEAAEAAAEASDSLRRMSGEETPLLV